MPLHLQQYVPNDKIESTLERLNTTLISLRDNLAARNSLETQQPLKKTSAPAGLLPQKSSPDFTNNLEESLQQASRSLQNFSQKSRLEIDDLTLFIGQRFSSINFGNLLTNPIASITSFFTAKAHTGGFVNDLALPFQSDEVPIIAKRGEAIFTPKQLDSAESILQNAVGQKGGGGVTVNIHNNAPSVEISSQEQTSEQGESNIDIVISEAENLMARRIAMGSGLATVIENRYGVSPKSRGGL